MAIQSAIKGSKINRGELLSSFLKNDGELDEAYQTRQGEGLAGLVNQGIIRALPQAGQYEFLQDYSFNDRTPRSPDTTGAGQPFNTEEYLQSRLEEPDLATMEERERKRIQGQIDLIRTGETRELERIREQTADFKGSQRGMSARRGLGGSSFGGAQKQKITSAQGEKERLAGDIAEAKIQMALGNADDRALRRFEIERASVDRASAEYMDLIAREKTESKAEMKDLAASGVPREAIDDEYYNKSIEQTGYSPTVWDFLYDDAQAKANQITTECCGVEVTEEAGHCPNCGEPIN